jgi:nucleoside-diphosphate-sugar epimerase
VSSFLILGAGYIGAALAERALEDGHAVTLADNWFATDRSQLAALEERGARVETGDIRKREDIEQLLSLEHDRVYLLAAQASRPLAEQEPDYTEETNVTGARRVGEALAARGGPALTYASSLHVYGPALAGEVGPDHPYGRQGDLAHLSKIYAELCLTMLAEQRAFDLAILRLGIVYGPSPVEHSRPESQTVVDKFRRLAAAGEPLQLDDCGRATIGVVHIDDVTRILLGTQPAGVVVENVAAETVTVADVAALAQGQAPNGENAYVYKSPFSYPHRLGDYLEQSARVASL